MSKKMTAPAADMKFWRSNAKDSRTGEPINGRPAYIGFCPQTGDTPRPFLPETWEGVTPAADAAAVIVGKSTAGRIAQAILTPCGATPELHAAMIARNGAQPVWYFTGEGYASPSYRNLKWHDRLESLQEWMTAGALTVIVSDEATGAHIATVRVTWGDKNEFGRFVKKSERGDKSLILRLIDEAIHG